MHSHTPIPFLRGVDLFNELSDQELLELLPFLQVYHCKPNSWVFREGERGRELFILKSGNVEILKQEAESGEFEELGSIEVGDYFGEMAHLENQKRSASIRTLGPAEVITLDLDALQKAPDRETLYSKILIPLGRKVSSRLRSTDEKLINYLRDKLSSMQSYTQINRTIIYFSILMALWFNMAQLRDVVPAEQRSLIDVIVTTVVIIGFGAVAFFIIKTSDYPPSFYGITSYRWLYYAFEGIIYSLPIIGIFTLLKWVLINSFHIFEGVSLFSPVYLKDTFRTYLILGSVYTMMAPLQELVTRGVLQSCFRNFFTGPNKVFFAILVSNLLFQIIHTVKNFWLALASFFLGIFWGILFEKQKSLVGVSISHAFIGCVLLFLLDYESLIRIIEEYQRSQK